MSFSSTTLNITQECFLFGSWEIKTSFKNNQSRTSLVAQWLRVRLPMQGTRVRALVREDPTCHGATKPVCHNYWACALEPVSPNYWSQCSTIREATTMRSTHTATKSSPRSLQLQKATCSNEDPMQPKINWLIKKKEKKKKTKAAYEVKVYTVLLNSPTFRVIIAVAPKFYLPSSF